MILQKYVQFLFSHIGYNKLICKLNWTQWLIPVTAASKEAETGLMI
jgi:hypothetical protein